MFLLKDVVFLYDERHAEDGKPSSHMDEDDWAVLEVYLKVVEPFEEASKLLGGDTYPAACMIIPMLDQVIKSY